MEMPRPPIYHGFEKKIHDEERKFCNENSTETPEEYLKSYGWRNVSAYFKIIEMPAKYHAAVNVIKRKIYCQNNILPALARDLGVSKSTLERMFKEKDPKLIDLFLNNPNFEDVTPTTEDFE